ncbi:MAG: phospholipase D-like domain-containing protein, partial [Candidatus Eremiobacterota bacterium]
VQSLVEAGIEVIRLYNTWDIFSPLHHKFAVFDEETVLTGSYNWYTVSAISDEEMSVIRDRGVAGKFLEEVYLLLSSFRLKHG